MSTVHNIVSLNTGRVYESINSYLMKVGLKSKNTQYNYEVAIRRFFIWHVGKSIEDLVNDDLDILNEKMIRYQYYLLEDCDYSNNTVNASIAPIARLYEHFARNRYIVKVEDVRVDKLPDDGERYGELSHSEAETMAVLAERQKKGVEKAGIIRLAYTTSFRKASLLAIKWSDIVFDSKSRLYLITAIGKRNKKHTRPIPVELYNELLKIKEQKYYSRYTDNKVFHLSDHTLWNMIDNLKKEMGIGEDRNVVFHSLRNVAAGFIRFNGGGIEEIREQLNQSGYGSLKHYMHEDKNYSNMAGMRMHETFEDNYVEQLSREELLQLIERQGEAVKTLLQREARKMVEHKKESGE